MPGAPVTSPAPTATPPRLPVAGAWHVALTYDVSGQPAVVVLGSFGDATSDQVAIANAFHTNARALMSTSTTLQSIVSHDASGSGNALQLPLPATNRTGTGAGNLITAYATLLRWGTSRGGRTGKGRTFVPGFVTGSLAADGRTLSSTALTAATTLGQAMADVAGFCVISHRAGTATPVDTYSVSSIVGVQRRRLRN